jgi:hypothetical protein
MLVVRFGRGVLVPGSRMTRVAGQAVGPSRVPGRGMGEVEEGVGMG